MKPCGLEVADKALWKKVNLTSNISIKSARRVAVKLIFENKASILARLAMAYSEILAFRLRTLLAGRDGVSEKRMFGGLAFLKHGHMFIGIAGDDLMARVGKPSYAALLGRAHVREMDFTGRPMAGFVFVSSEGLHEDTDLAFWVRHCEQFVSGLPPKH